MLLYSDSKLTVLFLKYFSLILAFLLIINFVSINKNPKNANLYKVNKIYHLDKLIYNISPINYIFSFKNNITKIEYNISIYDDKYNKIIPSYLGLFHKFHIFCISNDIKNNISIIYFANIYNNYYFSCIDYLNINDIVKFGISIFKKRKYIEFFNLFIFNSNLINYNNHIYKNDEKFDPLKRINIHNLNQKTKNENKTNNSNDKTFQLRQLFNLIPNLCY